MSKKSQMTAEEREVHDYAVKVRKMTDRQLFDYFGAMQAKQEINTPSEIITEFIDLVERKCGTGNGLGHSTVYKLRKLAAQEGLISGI